MKLVSAVLLILGVLSGSGRTGAQSIIPAPDGTATVVLPNGNQFTITGGQVSSDGSNLFHSFTQFGLTSGEIANFLASPSLQNILARVVGGDPSVINGLLQVSGGNANLFLMNPAGIILGPTASLNVPGSFTATTAHGIGIGSNWFSATGFNDYQNLVGAPTRYAFNSQPGSIVNAGNLAVGTEQSLILLGGTGVNTGNLTAPSGQIIVSAVPGESLVRLSQPGSPLSLDIQPLSSAATLPNALPITPLSLPQLLTGGQMSSATGVSVNAQGDVILTGSGSAIPSTPGTTIISGTLNTSNSNPSQTGGTVAVLGTLVGLLDQAQVNASGGAGGGTVLIGGDYLGQGSVANAAVTYIGQTVAIQANALSQGNGGKVIVWSDQTTRSYGSIDAQGGLQGGNGGFVETSSKGFLEVTRNPDVSAPLGIAGTWLIDPYDITIISDIGTLDGSSPDFTANADNSTIAADLITGALSNGQNVTISTGTGGSQAGNITVAASIGSPGNGTGSTLTLLAANDVVFTSGVSINLSASSTKGETRGGNLTIIAGGLVDINDINTSARNFGGSQAIAGNVSITAGQTISVGTIDAFAIGSSSSMDVVQAGTVSLQTTPAFGGDIQFASIDAAAKNSGAISGTFIGGTVLISANGMVQGTSDIDGITINAASQAGSATPVPGYIAITHDGGPNNIPFEIGTSSSNGVVAALQTIDDTPISTGGYPVLATGGSVSAGTNITITSINSPPTLSADPLIVSLGSGVPFKVTYETLQLQVADANGDTVFIVIDDILGGILLVNDEPVGRGTTINPGDELEFIPFPDTTDAAPGFTIKASDRVSESAPFPITALPDLEDVELEEEEEEASDLFDLTDLALDDLTTLDELGEVEGEFTEDFTEYYGLPEPPPTSLAQSQAILAEIAAKTGIKPALVYARFIPSDLIPPDKQRQPAAGGIQPDSEILWEFNSQGLTTTVTPRRSRPGKSERKELDSDQLELVIVTADGDPLRKRVPGVSRGTILKLAQTFRQTVTDPTSNAYLASAQELYQILIAPLEAQMKLKGIDNLTFLSDTGLRSLPLAALHDGQQFLIEKYSLGLMPSLSLTDTRYVNIQQSRVLAMGASQFQDQSPLPAVPKELSRIAGDLWTGRAFLNQGFTISNLQAQRQQENYGILHLATHGEFRAGSPANSYIQFWDRKLTLDQLRTLKLNNPPIELLVLSACRTALGDRQAELGFAGLAVQAGVKTALGSLWYVSDEGTLALMSEFYQNLKETPVKAEALRRSQLAMMRGQVQISNGQLVGPRGVTQLPPELANLGKGTLAHPYYWAAFTLIGNPW